jgi:hypothetical protein
MKLGNWVPISKAFTKYLPKGRPYTEIEAAFSVEVDYDNANEVTVLGYAELWQWSRNRVRLFLKRMSIKITYPENTHKKQNQKGQISIQIMDRKGAQKGQIRIINSKDLQGQKDRKRTDKGQIRDRCRTTTSYPNPNPKKNNTSFRFAEWWDVYPKKVEKKKCLAKWKSRGLDKLADMLIADVKKRRKSKKWQNGFIPNPLTYINGDRWEDELDEPNRSIKLQTTEEQDLARWKGIQNKK